MNVPLVDLKAGDVIIITPHTSMTKAEAQYVMDGTNEILC